ncbi:uncharacterized protein LOC133982253 isoform X3 [Scomber scombrus]|uniref:uncharacterized protein LOC133982253 isoform X3 n=1 Tax=Scomber scombrus TaxID=13677 RepID=UPI002DDA0EEB|nr:uncharacterized protein LOC133982253 isoform X3 [Scomber scombrus]
MTSEIYFESGPGGNNASLQSTTVGGSKPLHRFIKGEPKIIGIVVLVLGVSFIIISAALQADTIGHISSIFPPGNLLGTLYILCGILYILTEHNPTKKKDMGITLEAIFVFYSFVGAIIFIVMSILAGAALRSTKSQVILMMSTTPTETPAEL